MSFACRAFRSVTTISIATIEITAKFADYDGDAITSTFLSRVSGLVVVVAAAAAAAAAGC